MGVGGRVSKVAAAALALMLAIPAAAQFSDAYTFLKAVKDRDGTKVTEYLNKAGTPVLNTRDPSSGETALHIVVRRHDQSWVAFILSKRPQLDIKDGDGNTPLMVAAQLNDLDALNLLLDVGARVDPVNSRGETPLIVAVQQRNLGAVRALVAHGANPTIADTIAGKSARDYAAEDQRGAATVKLLAEVKATPKKVVAGPVR